MSYAVGNQSGEVYNAYLSRGRANSAASKDPSLRVWESSLDVWVRCALAPPTPFIALVLTCVIVAAVVLATG